MAERINKKELARRMAEQEGLDQKTAEAQVDLVFDTIYEAIKAGEGVTIRNFGSFYVKSRYSGTWTFKFTPAAKLKALLGWSSSYKGKL